MKEEGSSATKPCTRFNGFKGWILRSKGRGPRFEGESEGGSEGEGENWKAGRVSEWENFYFFLLPSSFFLLPSSFFLVPSSFFLLLSSFFLQKLTPESGGSNCRI